MKNVLDISCLDKYSSGAKQRFLNFYTELVLKEKKKTFIIIYTSEDNLKPFVNFQNVEFKKNPIHQDNYFKKLLSIIYVTVFSNYNSNKINTIEFFTLPFYRLSKSKNIITIHDLRKLFFSKFFLNKFFLNFFYKIFLKKIDRIIVVSNSIKKEILNLTGNLNVSVIYNTIDEKFFQKINSKKLLSIKKKYNLKKNFLLTVGHQEKRKNFIRLIKAIYILKKDIKNIQLIIIGQKSDQSVKIRKLIYDLDLDKNVKILSNLEDSEVRCFYRLSKLFVFPSIYEGFGIPILESMASKLPMVLSNIEVFREITENQYEYFDEFDPLSIANKIKFVLNQKKIRDKMIIYGIKRVNFFRLKKQRKNLLKIYNKFN